MPVPRLSSYQAVNRRLLPILVLHVEIALAGLTPGSRLIARSLIRLFLIHVIDFFNQIDWFDAKRGSQMKKRHNRWIAFPSFKVTYILLREPGRFRKLFLRETLCLPNPRKIQSYKATHIHARRLDDHTL